MDVSHNTDFDSARQAHEIMEICTRLERLLQDFNASSPTTPLHHISDLIQKAKNIKAPDVSASTVDKSKEVEEEMQEEISFKTPKDKSLTLTPSIDQTLKPVIILYDLETTDCKVKRSQIGITELCMLKIKPGCTEASLQGKSTQKFYRLVLPSQAFSPTATRLTGWTRQRLKDAGATAFQDIFPDLVKFLTEDNAPVCLIAHNGMGFDHNILYHHIRRVSSDAWLNDLGHVTYADSIYIWKQFDKTRSSYSLNSLPQNMKTGAGRHTAEGDCLITLRMLRSIAKVETGPKQPCQDQAWMDCAVRVSQLPSTLQTRIQKRE